MAKTIKEIFKDLKEWQKENPEERSIVAIAGYEGENITMTMVGQKRDLVENVATKMIQSKEFSDAITESLKAVLRYAHEVEDN